MTFWKFFKRFFRHLKFARNCWMIRDIIFIPQTSFIISRALNFQYSVRSAELNNKKFLFASLLHKRPHLVHALVHEVSLALRFCACWQWQQRTRAFRSPGSPIFIWRNASVRIQSRTTASRCFQQYRWLVVIIVVFFVVTLRH